MYAAWWETYLILQYEYERKGLKGESKWLQEPFAV